MRLKLERDHQGGKEVVRVLESSAGPFGDAILQAELEKVQLTLTKGRPRRVVFIIWLLEVDM